MAEPRIEGQNKPKGVFKCFHQAEAARELPGRVRGHHLGGRVSGSWAFPGRVACQPAATARLRLAAFCFRSSCAVIGKRGQLAFDQSSFGKQEVNRLLPQLFSLL